MDKGITREQVERVARIYRSNQDASRALGIEPRSFGRLCRRYGIETPYVQKRQQGAAIAESKTSTEKQQAHPWRVPLAHR